MAYRIKGEFDCARSDLQKALVLGYDQAAIDATLEQFP